MAGSEVLLAIADGVARITLNRPAVLNAENMAWVDGLERAVDAVAAEREVRVVVVQGAGRAFCAGMDLGMLASGGMPEGFYEGQERAFRRLETIDKITIAAIHGYCIGGGLQLAIACDLRICADDAQLGLPALREGLFPGMAVHRLPPLVGIGRARRLILSGELIDGAAALAIGLVDHVVPAASFAEQTDRLVAQYRDVPVTAAIASKQLLAASLTGTFDEVLEASKPLLNACLDSPEAAAAAESWRQRRR
ncbi:MAG TPA: enoyl-CoA hydratase/isomerase family protein [Conexibacter sp.]|nr:enoyl-CoA hydratase/isomerase family protein [Conexibacter sp.]